MSERIGEEIAFWDPKQKHVGVPGSHRRHVEASRTKRSRGYKLRA